MVLEDDDEAAIASGRDRLTAEILQRAAVLQRAVLEQYQDRRLATDARRDGRATVAHAPRRTLCADAALAAAGIARQRRA